MILQMLRLPAMTGTHSETSKRQTMSITYKEQARQFAGFIPEPKRSDFYAFMKRVAGINVLDPDVIEIVETPTRTVKQAQADVSGVPTCFTTTRLREKDVIDLSGVIFPFSTIVDIWTQYANQEGTLRERKKMSFKDICKALGVTEEAAVIAQRAYAPYGGKFNDETGYEAKKRAVTIALREKQKHMAKRRIK